MLFAAPPISSTKKNAMCKCVKILLCFVVVDGIDASAAKIQNLPSSDGICDASFSPPRALFCCETNRFDYLAGGKRANKAVRVCSCVTLTAGTQTPACALSPMKQSQIFILVPSRSFKMGKIPVVLL